MLTLEILKRIVPLDGKRAATLYPPLVAAMAEFGIDTWLRIAAFIAQVAHETASFVYLAEIASGRAYDNRADLGNTRPEAIAVAKANGSSPGRWWKGRGLIQITGFDNYLACGKALGLDLLNHPELLEEPVNAARSAAWFWQAHKLNKWADSGDIDGVSDVINRGRKTAAYGDARGFPERLAFYDRALAERPSDQA